MFYYGMQLETEMNEKIGRSRTCMYVPVFIDCNCLGEICAIVMMFWF